jgi:hypothetical protein
VSLFRQVELEGGNSEKEDAQQNRHLRPSAEACFFGRACKLGTWSGWLFLNDRNLNF